MSLLGRVLVVALLLAVSAVSEGVPGRGGKRDFPQGTKCPVHTGTVGSGDPLVFVARRTEATLTFLTCDDRGPQFVGSGIDLSIDDLIVVDRAVWNANRLAYPGEVPDSYRVDRSTVNCYLDNPPVIDVFRRDAARAPSSTMPLYERFEGSSRNWALVNASFAVEDKDFVNGNEPNDTSQSRSLILARSERNGSPGSQCSMASVWLSGLGRGREYVVDFSWYASGFSDAGQDILTVAFDDESTAPARDRSPVVRKVRLRSPRSHGAPSIANAPQKNGSAHSGRPRISRLARVSAPE
jgi:hypothetical protein